MSYYMYPERRKSTFDWLRIIAVVCILTALVAVIGTKYKSSDQIAQLKAEVKALQEKEVYYKDIERQLFNMKAEGVVIDKYEDKLQEQSTTAEQKLMEKDAKINSLISYNNELSKQSAALENTVKKFSYATGTRPQNWRIPQEVSRGSYDRQRNNMEYVGEWLGTYYAPNPKECGNNKGLTASGLPVEPGRTIAVDPKYWKLGTKFYIEGIGEVQAIDTGSAIKGRNRFDFCVLDTKLSGAGNFKAKVYVIKE